MNVRNVRSAGVVLAAALLVLAPLAEALAQATGGTSGKPPAAKSAGARKPGRNRVPRPVAQAQALLGRPLTEAQKKAVLAAAKERDKAMKPIRDRYRAKVAKALGMTVAQLEAKEKALRDRQRRAGGVSNAR